MKSKTSTKWFFCRHCGSRFRSAFMARNCFELDMSNLTNHGTNDKPINSTNVSLKNK